MTQESKPRLGNKRIYISVTIIAIVLIAFVSWQAYSTLQKPKSPTVYVNLPPMELTLIGANGTQKILNATDIAQISPFSGQAGFKNSAGSIGGVGNYTGVPITTLCQQVGGIDANDSVKMTASDGYSLVFSYNQTNGRGFVTYDPTTGNEVTSKEPLTMVAAYYKDGANITSDGPIRIVIVGTEGLLTDGHYWIKWVTKIQIIPAIVDWILELKDVSNVDSTHTFEYNVTRSYFEAGEVPTPHCHGMNWTDSNGNIWTGIPLWLLVGIVNNWKFDMEANAFNDSQANDNSYEVRVISQNGGYRSFNSSFVAHNNNIIVANRLNGAVLPESYWPLRLVGPDVSSDNMVVSIIEIELVFSGN